MSIYYYCSNLCIIIQTFKCKIAGTNSIFVIWNRLNFVWPGSKYLDIFWTSFWHPPDILWMFFHQKKPCWCCYCFSAVTAPLFECSRFPGIIYLHKSTIGLNHCDFCSCWCMHYYTSPNLPLEILWTPLDALWTSSGYPLEILWTSSGHPLDKSLFSCFPYLYIL